MRLFTYLQFMCMYTIMVTTLKRINNNSFNPSACKREYVFYSVIFT